MKKTTSPKYCVLIPTYNNATTIVDVLTSVLEYSSYVIVVNDGSTDATSEKLIRFGNKIQIIEYEKNKGKGYALRRGMEHARLLGFDYVITMDSDGQHFAQDIPAFVQSIEANCGALIVGSRSFSHENMPAKNTFANKFSNFWFTVQTLQKVPDTQTGFRAYPIFRLGKNRSPLCRYEEELFLLVRAAWKGIPIVSIPVQVYYAPQGERVSHFRPFQDFARISLLNTFLCFAAIFYGYPAMLLNKIFHYK